MTAMTSTLKQAFAVRWKPSKDLAVVALSWILVVACLYTATLIVGDKVWGGMAYFTLIKDGLNLPVTASLGFIDALALMFVLVWLAARYYKKHSENK